MKIAFVGNFDVSYSSENHHASSLETLGHEVVKLQEAKTRTETILEIAMDCDILVWVHTHGWVTEGAIDVGMLFRLLKKSGVITLSYHLDLWLGIKRQKDLEADPFYKEIEHFFATDKLMADWFNSFTKVKGHYIPAGVYDKEVYIDRTPHQFTNDVIFVGSKGYHSEWKYRPKLINHLSETFGSKFTHIGGDGAGTVRGAELNSLYGSSKVAVGDTLCLNFKYPYYFSDRLFESTGRGAFTIFPYITGIEDNFVIDKEIVTYKFDDFNELDEKIRYYLENETEREQIRLAGHERTKKEHTYLHRWTAILERVQNDKDD